MYNAVLQTVYKDGVIVRPSSISDAKLRADKQIKKMMKKQRREYFKGELAKVESKAKPLRDEIKLLDDERRRIYQLMHR